MENIMFDIIAKQQSLTDKKKRKIMRNEQQDKAAFVSFCIEQYCKAKNMSTDDVVNLFEHYGITEHFCEFSSIFFIQRRHFMPLNSLNQKL